MWSHCFWFCFDTFSKFCHVLLSALVFLVFFLFFFFWFWPVETHYAVHCQNSFLLIPLSIIFLFAFLFVALHAFVVRTDFVLPFSSLVYHSLLSLHFFLYSNLHLPKFAHIPCSMKLLYVSKSFVVSMFLFSTLAIWMQFTCTPYVSSKKKAKFGIFHYWTNFYCWIRWIIS